MKAIVYTQYGPPEMLRLQEVEKPAPKDDEVLIKVYAASINSMEWRMLRANPFFLRFMEGFSKPKNPILGTDVAGRVEAVGKNASQFRQGDEVFGFGKSTYAEYACAKESLIALKPANRSFEEAAAVGIAAITALQAFQQAGGVKPGQKVLIQGASGGVGVFAVQIAKSYGAEVTGVCSTRNVDMLRSLGVDHIIDYKKEDFTRNGQRYDIIIGVNGYHSIFDYQRALNPQGTYVMAGGHMAQIFQSMLLGPMLSKNGGKKMTGVSAHQSQKDLPVLKELLETGKILPVIDARYPLEKTAEAFRYFEEVHPKGKVIITMGA